MTLFLKSTAKVFKNIPYMCGRGLSSRGEFYHQRLFFSFSAYFVLYFCVAVLVTWWNGLPVVTYIIRPIRVSNETCRLFHQHTRPIVFLLLLIRRVMSESFSKIILGRRQNILQYAHIQNTLPGLLYIFWSFIVSTASQSTRLHLLFHAARLSDEGAGGDCLQQINISTHVSGPSTHRSGWKLLQSFLWRKEMMPNQPGENGMAQNNGVIEEH